MIRVHNMHERRFHVSQDRVGSLIDGLGSATDRLWPRPQWPAMRFDRPLQVGALGGHGPIRYQVEIYVPGSRVRFRLRSPRGFDGVHEFEVLPAEGTGTTLRHVLDMNARGAAVLTWPCVFSPLHDALVEDCLDTAARELGEVIPSREWSLRVRMLRAAFRPLRRSRRAHHAGS